MAAHTFFCRETRCDGEAHVSGGLCDSCFEMEAARLQREHCPPRCENCKHLVDELFNDRWCADCWNTSDIDGLLFPLEEGDVCSCCHMGQRMSNSLCVECSKGCHRADDLRAECLGCWCECPILALTDGYCPCCCQDDEEEQELPPKLCKDCGTLRVETEPELQCDWFCPPCWTARFKKHVCSGERIDDGRNESYMCDNSDDPHCPQHIGEWLF